MTTVFLFWLIFIDMIVIYFWDKCNGGYLEHVL